MLMRALVLVMLMHGLAAASGPPTWCHGKVTDPDAAWAATAENSLQDYRSSRHSQYRLFEVARLVCNAPRSPDAQKLTDEIVKAWMKESGLGEAEAMASLGARVDKAAWEADRDRLCDVLKEAGFEKIPRAKSFLFGCNGTPLWLQPGTSMDDLADMVDRGAVSHDDLAHLAWMINRTYQDLEQDKRAIAKYVVDQVDFRILPTDAILHELDVEPYRGNRYARQILVESLAYLRVAVARVEAAVAKKAQDPAWKTILVTAPGKGAAAWDQAVDRAKDVVARSEELGRKAGCEKPLRADLLPILKGLPHKDVATTLASISDHPLAGMLLANLATCLIKGEGKHGPGQTVDKLAAAVRKVRGPRMAAYFAALDAVAALGESSPLEPVELPRLSDPPGGHAKSFENTGEHGLIVGVAKAGKGITVTFEQKKTREMSQACVESKRIDRVMPDGKVVYRQDCHDTGLVWVTRGPMPVTVEHAYADGVKVGRVARFDTDLGNPHAIPLVIFGDKTGAKLVGIGTFLLE